MKPFNPKPRPCKACAKQFVPAKPLQSVCSPRCAVKKVKQDKAAERAKVATKKEAIKKRGELVHEAQVAFNAFIRFRDRNTTCICCGMPFAANKPGGSMDAGHFRSRGSAPNLRFDENNVFGQRKGCNRPGGTTYGQFRKGVIARIGLAAVEALEADNEPRKWTHDELRAIRDTYRAKLKELKKGA